MKTKINLKALLLSTSAPLTFIFMYLVTTLFGNLGILAIATGLFIIVVWAKVYFWIDELVSDFEWREDK